MQQGMVTIVDEETSEEIYLPLINRDRFIANRNLLYALVADGPLWVFKLQLHVPIQTNF